MSDTKVDHEHHSPSPPPPATRARKSKVTSHCKRFWWIYLITVICIVVLVVCLVIFVGVPKIAQSKVDDSKLDIQGVHVIDTTSDAYRMEINSTITTDGKTKADISPFTGNLYLEDEEKPFATLDFPQTSGSKHQIVNISQDLKIADMDAFTKFNVWFANNETLKITVSGDTKAKPAGLDRKFGVKFSKTIDVKGLNMFNGTQVTDGKIALKKDSEGLNFYGKADIPNASHFTLDIGNVTFTNFVEDAEFGTLYIDNLLLTPGSNLVDIKGEMDQAGILKLVRTEKYCKTGIIPFKLLGTAVKNNGQDLSYFAAALGSANQTVDINIGKIIKDSIGYSVDCA